MYKKARVLKEIRKNMEDGGGLCNSVKSAGISLMTLWLWRKRYRRIEIYIQQLLENRQQVVEDALYKNAVTNQNVTAQIFYLKNHGWRDTPLFEQKIINQYVRIYRPANRTKNDMETASRATRRSV